MRAILISICISISICTLSFALDPAIYDAVMYAGEDYRLNLTLKDSAGSFMNLSGYSYKAQFRSAAAPAGVLYANYSAYVTGRSTGALTVRLSKTQTTALSGYAGFWDLQQTDTGSAVSYLLTGRALVKPTVTR